MSISVNIDTTNINGAMRALARISGKDFKQVVRAETFKILESAMKSTSAASVASIKSAVEQQEGGWYAPGYQTQHPSTAPRDKRARRFYWLANRYPDDLWQQINAERAANLKNRLAARGLLKKAWLQLSDDLMGLIAAPGYVAKATTPRGDYPGDTSATETAPGATYTILARIARTYDRRIFTALRKAVNKRTNYFRAALKRGFLDTTAKVAARYPGLYTS